MSDNMTPAAIIALITAGLSIEKQIQQLITDLRNAGVSDDTLLDAAMAKDADTHARVKELLARIPA